MSPLTFGNVLGWTCLLLIASATQARAQALDTFTLANGLRVVLQEDKRQPVIGVSMGYGNGSFHDPPHRAELAHLCEHLMMLAPAPHTGSTWERMRMVGAEQGATTYATDMFSYAELPKEHLETALWIESERMAFVIQAIDKPLLERTKKVIKREWRERNPDHLVERDQLIESAVYGSDHAMFRYATREPDLGDIDLDDVRWWMQHVLQPSNAVLSIAGDFDAQTARQLIERYFGPITPAVAHAREALAVATDHFSTRLARDELLVWDRSLITVEWPVRELPVADAYALDVAAALLEDELRTQLADTATLLDVRFQEHATHARFIVTLGRALHANPVFMVGVLDDILKNFKPTDLVQTHFESMRAGLLLRLLTEGENFATRATKASMRTLRKVRATDEERIAAVRGLSGQDVSRTVAAELIAKPRVVLLPNATVVKAHRGALR